MNNKTTNMIENSCIY